MEGIIIVIRCVLLAFLFLFCVTSSFAANRQVKKFYVRNYGAVQITHASAKGGIMVKSLKSTLPIGIPQVLDER